MMSPEEILKLENIIAELTEIYNDIDKVGELAKLLKAKLSLVNTADIRSEQSLNQAQQYLAKIIEMIG